MGTSLSAKAAGELAKAAAIVKAKADVSAPVLVIGHTDAKVSGSYNDKLSRDRAASATAVLRRLLPGTSLTPSGRGAGAEPAG